MFFGSGSRSGRVSPPDDSTGYATGVGIHQGGAAPLFLSRFNFNSFLFIFLFYFFMFLEVV